MLAPLTRRRLLLAGGGLGLVAVAVALLARLALTGMAATFLLHLAGASEVKFTVARASPWRVDFEDVAFHVRAQAFTAKHVSFQRSHWWSLSAGAVRVEQAWLPVTIDGSDTNPWVWTTYQHGTAAFSALKFPVEEITLDGQLVVRAAALPEQALTVRLEARQTPQKTWEGRATAEGPGLGLKGEGRFDPASKELVFSLPEVALDLQPWQGFVQRLVLFPGGAVELAGKLAGSAAGTWRGKVFTAGAKVRLREGRIANLARGVAAEGIEADLEFTDLDQFVTKPGTLRAATVRVGQLVLRDIDAEFAFGDANRIVVSRAALQALGGTVAVEPFKYFLNQRELDVVVLADNISVEEVMALTRDLPAKASGRLDGRLPVHVDEGGLRLGTGWLALKPGVYAQIQLHAAGLLTQGLATNNPRYPIMKKVEAGLLQLKVGELRLDIRPPNAPAGRSAQLHLVGEPVDPEVKAPIILDLNVNGPLEKLLNMGLDSRISFGGKP